MVETALFTNQIPKKLSDKLSRIYLGNEFCQYRLPTPETLSKLFDLGLPVTIATPLVTSEGLRRIEALAKRVQSLGMKAELMVNDYGVAETFKGDEALSLISGTLLSRQFFDYQGENFIYADEDFFALFKKRFSITRFDITSYPKKINPVLPRNLEDFSLSLHMPFQAVSASRQCLFRYHETSPDQPLDKGVCRADLCTKHIVSLRYPTRFHETFLLCGNSVFLQNQSFPHDAATLRKMHADRLVYMRKLAW